MVSIIRILLALIIDIIDALVFIPTTDIGEAPAMWLAAHILGVKEESLKLLAAIDGILPPPFDIFPTLTTIVIYEEFKK